MFDAQHNENHPYRKEWEKLLNDLKGAVAKNEIFKGNNLGDQLEKKINVSKAEGLFLGNTARIGDNIHIVKATNSLAKELGLFYQNGKATTNKRWVLEQPTEQEGVGRGDGFYASDSLGNRQSMKKADVMLLAMVHGLPYQLWAPGVNIAQFTTLAQKARSARENDTGSRPFWALESWHIIQSLSKGAPYLSVFDNKEVAEEFYTRHLGPGQGDADRGLDIQQDTRYLTPDTPLWFGMEIPNQQIPESFKDGQALLFLSPIEDSGQAGEIPVYVVSNKQAHEGILTNGSCYKSPKVMGTNIRLPEGTFDIWLVAAAKHDITTGRSSRLNDMGSFACYANDVPGNALASIPPDRFSDLAEALLRANPEYFAVLKKTITVRAS